MRKDGKKRKKLTVLMFATIASFVLVRCGSKKEDDPPAATIVVGKLSVTCSGVSCIGTEGK